ncbi:hypothetical protein BJY24_005429 [Nocardia transvalensis]|uniref:Uncharacterized protein n=1 Tax=Nocardia transvalensis TaxID=37333 RepID=A0A7W9UKP3_9NOCA|nr:hypothetical protein [Nocardia transvalensis]MBB5916517.1 hypothetical protein [Nocardia transvalensis]
MDDAVLPSPDGPDGRATAPAFEETFDADHFADAGDRLVRHLFDVGLRLHTVRDALDRPLGETDGASAAVGAVLDDLDVVIRDAGLVMLALNGNRLAATTADPGDRRTRHH